MTFEELKNKYIPENQADGVDTLLEQYLTYLDLETLEVFQVQQRVRRYIESIEDVLELINDDTTTLRIEATSLVVTIKTYLEQFLKDLGEVSW